MAVKALLVLGCNTTAKILKTLLVKMVDNIEVSIRESGGEVVQIYSEGQQNYDLVFVATGLPDISGLEVVKKIKEKDAAARIVGISCEANFEHAFVEAGVNVFMENPPNFEKLGNVLSIIGIL